MSQHVETVRIPSSYRENFQLYLDQHRKIAREAAADAVVEHYKNLRRRFPQHPYSHTGKPFRPFIPVVPYDTPSLSPAERAALVGKFADHFFYEWHAQLCRTPRPLAPRAVRPPLLPVQEPYARIRRTVRAAEEKWMQAKAYARSWRDWAVDTRDRARKEYAHAAFMAERKYWLALTAYRQSPWPNTLRQLRNLLFGLLLLILLVWLGWAKMLAAVNALVRGASEPFFEESPGYMVWSVTPPRCDCGC
ncbi:hypothetical protein Daesc_002992 [Daldinia eschscholtzii]|uniref:Uncharacterized protein n=1 Tax=Daldinia eschscholtzii TaxID=292717 RepID=A0AAX6MSI1_9PEZI